MTYYDKITCKIRSTYLNDFIRLQKYSIKITHIRDVYQPLDQFHRQSMNEFFVEHNHYQPVTGNSSSLNVIIQKECMVS